MGHFHLPPHLIQCTPSLLSGAFASSLEELSSSVTANSDSLLEAVQILITEVTVLKSDNLRLRADFDQASSQIEKLQEANKALTDNLQQQSRKVLFSSASPNPSTKSNKLRGIAKLSESDETFMNRLQNLEDKLSCVSDESDASDVFFVGCNIHVRDGSGATEGVDGSLQSGRGNLILGYNEASRNGESPEVCSNSSAADVVTCRQEGGIWGRDLQTGIHNLVVGSGHTFTQHSGIVAGRNNAITGVGANAIGGRSNHASGEMASVTGGTENTATGKSSVVVGGFDNNASGDDAVVSGGSYNVAGGNASVVVAGENNQATGETSFISGGTMNEVSGEYSCATNSYATVSTGKEASITGGREVFAGLDETIISGRVFGFPGTPQAALP